jgi:hypothetical protein
VAIADPELDIVRGFAVQVWQDFRNVLQFVVEDGG